MRLGTFCHPGEMQRNMLAQLIIRDIVLAERLDVVFDCGLNIVTGETGAGKSLLSGALALALGARGRAGLVRFGSEAGEVIALFDIPSGHPSRQLLMNGGIKDDDDTLILRRIQFADGRTRAFVNDCPVSAGFLKDLGTMLVEIHDQHDAMRLLDSAGHREILDAFGGLNEDVQMVRVSWQNLEDMRKAATLREEQVATILRDRGYLEHTLSELDKLVPQVGEEDYLVRQRSSMIQAGKVIDDLRSVLEAIDGDHSILSRLLAMQHQLTRHSEEAKDLLSQPIQALDRVVIEMIELQDSLRDSIGQCNFDSDKLEQAEERLFALRAIARKHGVMLDDLPEMQEKIRQDIEVIDQAGSEALRYVQRAQQAELSYLAIATDLSKKRAEAALLLDAAVLQELEPLKLKQACFTTQIDVNEASAGAHGFDRVHFLVQTNVGAKAGKIHEIASGGELSRFILALKVVLVNHGSVSTMIFDEIDSAVGGAVSYAVGQRLARLSRGGIQVIAVTHAPQVAACADHHLRISKISHDSELPDGSDTTVMRVDLLDNDSRQEEIARMLSGATITDEARAQAHSLLSLAS